MIDKQDDTLRRMYEAALRRHASGGRTASVPLDRIIALVDRRGSEEERLATLNAVMSDPESTKDFELLRSLAANRPATRSSWTRRPYVLTSVALAATLLIVAISTLRAPLNTNDDPSRGVTQGAALLLPPVEATPQTSRKFEWRSVRGAREYVLEILTSGGTPIFSTRTSDTTTLLPANVRIEPRTEYRWWVVSELSDGTQRRSAFRRLIIRDAK